MGRFGAAGAKSASSKEASDKTREIDEHWRKIEQAAKANAAGMVTTLIQDAPPRMQHPLRCRLEDWFDKEFALEPGDQGLYRLIFDIWPEIPVRIFHLSMVPRLFEARGRWDQYKDRMAAKAKDLKIQDVMDGMRKAAQSTQPGSGSEIS